MTHKGWWVVKHQTNKQTNKYLCGNHFAYLRTGVQCPLIEHDNSGVRIIMMLNQNEVQVSN